MFGTIRLYLYAGVAAVIVSALLYAKHEWHDKIVNQKERLEEQLKSTGDALNKCYIDSRKNSVESFIEGVGNVDENISIDLDSLHT